MNETELQHYGVPGMKWGVRKSPEVASARSAYKSAKKEYNRSFKEANKKAIAAYSPIKSHRKANDERWNKAFSDADKLNNAKKQYKQAKRGVKVEDKAQKTNEKRTMDASERYFANTKSNANLKKAGYGAKVAGAVLNTIGQQQYNKYKNNSTPGKTAVINGMGYSAKALNAIGDVAIAGSWVKQISDYYTYKKS